MNILIIAPALSNRGRGNRITVARWGRIFTELGHEVSFDNEYNGQACDLLVALHAIQSADSVAAFRQAFPGRPVIVALTGTDIYGLGEMFDEAGQEAARRSMEMATRLVAFHGRAFEEVPESLRDKGVVIAQAIEPPGQAAERRDQVFEVCVVGELREVKDPFRTGLAVRRLPSSSMVRVLHVGAASSEEMAERAAKEEHSNARYHWLGEVSHGETLELMARCRLLSLSSRHEGGPNVLTEAIGLGTPVVAARIPGISGVLGEDYPGYFPVGDTEALCELLQRAETDASFYESLREACAALADTTLPAREHQAWKTLLESI